MRKWEDLPEYMKCDEVKEYYDILSKKKFSLKMKRAFDLVAGTGVLIAVSYTHLINYCLSMDSLKMHLQRLSLAHGSMIL